MGAHRILESSLHRPGTVRVDRVDSLKSTQENEMRTNHSQKEMIQENRIKLGQSCGDGGWRAKETGQRVKLRVLATATTSPRNSFLNEEISR